MARFKTKTKTTTWTRSPEKGELLTLVQFGAKELQTALKRPEFQEIQFSLEELRTLEHEHSISPHKILDLLQQKVGKLKTAQKEGV